MKRPKIDSGQKGIFDFAEDLLSKEEKLELIQSNQNRIEDSDHKIKNKDIIRDKNQQLKLSEGELEKELEDIINLRSEQIIISKDNYPSIVMNDNKYQFDQSIDNLSGCNHKSKNIFNQCIFQIRQAFFGKVSDNCKDDIEKKLRIDIRKQLDKYKNYPYEKLKTNNYKNVVYKLLDKYFKDESHKRDVESKDNNNYSWSPQAAQQIIDMSVEAWLDNDLAIRDYKKNPDHRKDYTGEPGLVKYRKGSEYISVFTNQQCKIENKNILDLKSMNEDRLRYINKNFLTFPDHLGIKPIETRLNDGTDLREVRIIPLIKRCHYKIEIVYKKVIDKIRIGKYKDKFISINELNLDPNRIIGIDTGQENVITIANNIGLSPIIIKGGILLSINQWFDKIGSRLYQTYYRQQSFKGQESKGKKIVMGSKMKILSFNRTNKILDILHKISRYIINYCINNRIGTIVWGRNPGWKQNINIGKRNNQKFTKIPHYLLFKILKYKTEEIGIKVIDIEESHTSKCSFLDLENIGHKEKGQYLGKRIKRGLFRSLKGIVLNADVNAAYNMIRKVFLDAFHKFVRIVNGKNELMINAIGIEGVVLHPERLSIKDLLSRPNTC